MSAIQPPSRMLQAGCAIISLFSLLPWSKLASTALMGAIESDAPLMSSLTAWLVMLLPLWIAWFAIRAWEQRNASSNAAMVMALPALLLISVALLLPSNRLIS